MSCLKRFITFDHFDILTDGEGNSVSVDPESVCWQKNGKFNMNFPFEHLGFLGEGEAPQMDQIFMGYNRQGPNGKLV